MEEVNNELAKIRATQERILYWLDAMDKKLDRVISYIDRIESLEYQLNRDAKEMVINLVANLFANSRLENNNR